jgi:hypothetical protein
MYQVIKINIKLYFKEIEYEGMGCIHLAHDRYQWRGIMYTVVTLRVP